LKNFRAHAKIISYSGRRNPMAPIWERFGNQPIPGILRMLSKFFKIAGCLA
jgi:hypothetical protein